MVTAALKSFNNALMSNLGSGMFNLTINGVNTDSQSFNADYFMYPLSFNTASFFVNNKS